jgi:thiol-disulfide isomerase/thioredoxin
MNPEENSTNSDAARSLATADATTGATVYTDLDGNPVDLSQYAGQIRVVNSWATWCPFCTDELKDLETLAGELGEDGVVIAINRGEPAAKIKAYLQRLGEFPNVIFVKDESDTFYKSISGQAMPETMFYTADGTIAVHQRGFMNLETMRSLLIESRSKPE